MLPAFLAKGWDGLVILKVGKALGIFEDKKIGVLMGGLSSEREISLSTGNSVMEAMARKGLKAFPIDVDRDIAKTLQGIDLAFIALHGTYGEDGCIQGVLEFLKIPYIQGYHF